MTPEDLETKSYKELSNLEERARHWIDKTDKQKQKEDARIVLENIAQERERRRLIKKAEANEEGLYWVNGHVGAVANDRRCKLYRNDELIGRIFQVHTHGHTVSRDDNYEVLINETTVAKFEKIEDAQAFLWSQFSKDSK